MAIKKIYLSGEFNFQAAESIVKTACQSSRHLIALIPDEQMTRSNQKLWRAYARQAARYLNGVEFFPHEDASELAEASDRNAENLAAIATRADEMLATIEQLERQLSAGTIDPCDAFVQFLNPSEDNQDRHEITRKEFVSETLKGSQDFVYQVYNTILSIDPSALINIWARQNYQGHLGHIRLLQNIRLLEHVGIDPTSLNPRHVLEFGPGVGGLYPLFLAQGADVEVIDKNSSIRYLALQRGVKGTHEVKLGQTETNLKEELTLTKQNTDFLVGIGLLNIFLYDSVDAYSLTVAWLTYLIGGGTGFWVTYNQPPLNRRNDTEYIKHQNKISREVFLGHGWEDMTEVVLMERLGILGLDYRRHADFRVFVHRKADNA